MTRLKPDSVHYILYIPLLCALDGMQNIFMLYLLHLFCLGFELQLLCLSLYIYSFGFTEKGSGKGTHQAIGIYGNGFKSGSMRLGRDALIFTKNGGCQSVGMLSQTFLHAIKAQAVIVPIAPFNQQTNILYKQETYFIPYIQHIIDIHFVIVIYLYFWHFAEATYIYLISYN